MKDNETWVDVYPAVEELLAASDEFYPIQCAAFVPTATEYVTAVTEVNFWEPNGSYVTKANYFLYEVLKHLDDEPLQVAANLLFRCHSDSQYDYNVADVLLERIERSLKNDLPLPLWIWEVAVHAIRDDRWYARYADMVPESHFLLWTQGFVNTIADELKGEKYLRRSWFDESRKNRTDDWGTIATAQFWELFAIHPERR